MTEDLIKGFLAALTFDGPKEQTFIYLFLYLNKEGIQREHLKQLFPFASFESQLEKLTQIGHLRLLNPLSVNPIYFLSSKGIQKALSIIAEIKA
jgi:hypothetical protein